MCKAWILLCCDQVSFLCGLYVGRRHEISRKRECSTVFYRPGPAFNVCACGPCPLALCTLCTPLRRRPEPLGYPYYPQTKHSAARSRAPKSHSSRTAIALAPKALAGAPANVRRILPSRQVVAASSIREKASQRRSFALGRQPCSRPSICKHQAEAGELWAPLPEWEKING